MDYALVPSAIMVYVLGHGSMSFGHGSMRLSHRTIPGVLFYNRGIGPCPSTITHCSSIISYHRTFPTKDL